MLVTFRIKDTATPLHSKPATVSFLELAALMRKLHTHDAAFDVDEGEFAAAPLNFEVNARTRYPWRRSPAASITVPTSSRWSRKRSSSGGRCASRIPDP